MVFARRGFQKNDSDPSARTILAADVAGYRQLELGIGINLDAVIVRVTTGFEESPTPPELRDWRCRKRLKKRFSSK
jgi:hypothetical protein